MSCCNCNKKNLIRTVQKYNLLIRLSERLFDKSEELLNKTVRKEIIEAIKTLCNASRTYDQARACKRVAEKILREDICGNVCNTNSNRCKELKDSANEQFDLSEGYIERAVCSLKNALNMIDKSIEAKEKGCILELRYEECIKTSNNTESLNNTECESNTNCENNINFFEYIDCLNSTEELVNTDSISEIGSLSELDSFRDSENINSQENLSELDSFGDSENINSQEDLSELDSFRDSENINSQEDLSELDSFRDLENINLQENLSGGDNFDVEEEFL